MAEAAATGVRVVGEEGRGGGEGGANSSIYRRRVNFVGLRETGPAVTLGLSHEYKINRNVSSIRISDQLLIINEKIIRILNPCRHLRFIFISRVCSQRGVNRMRD